MVEKPKSQCPRCLWAFHQEFYAAICGKSSKITLQTAQPELSSLAKLKCAERPQTQCSGHRFKGPGFPCCRVIMKLLGNELGYGPAPGPISLLPPTPSPKGREVWGSHVGGQPGHQTAQVTGRSMNSLYERDLANTEYNFLVVLTDLVQWLRSYLLSREEGEGIIRASWCLDKNLQKTETELQNVCLLRFSIICAVSARPESFP